VRWSGSSGLRFPSRLLCMGIEHLAELSVTMVSEGNPGEFIQIV
jgi:hypothetical protein